MMSKSGKNLEVAQEPQESVSLMFLPPSDILTNLPSVLLDRVHLLKEEKS